MLEAMDEVRRAEQKEHRSKVLLNSRKLLMIPQGRQSEGQREKVAELSKQYPKTGRAFRMAKRKARGYHTIEGFSCMIYLIAAKLRLACPNPLR